MAHAQKPDSVFQRKGRVHLYRRGCQFSRLLAAEVCASAVVMLDRPCPIQCKTAGYPLHSPFSPSLLHPCVSVCHHIPFLLYYTHAQRVRICYHNTDYVHINGHDRTILVILAKYCTRGESNGKLPPRTYPGCSVPEPYLSHDWALVPAKPGLQD